LKHRKEQNMATEFVAREKQIMTSDSCNLEDRNMMTNANPNTAITLRGLDLLLAAIEHIESDPQSWDQRVWHCESAHCLFGWCQILAGRPADPHNCREEVRELLGLCLADALWLCAPARTLDDFRWFAKEWAAGRLSMAGRDNDGYDRFGYDRFGFNRRDCGRWDYDIEYGPNLVTYNAEGYDHEGYDRYGFDRKGRDRWGYDRWGYDRRGRDREGYDRQGYGPDGYDRRGFNRAGRDRQGYDEEGYDRDGYDRCGYDRKGYDREGYDRCGYDREGYNRDGYDRAGRRRETS